MAEKFYRVTLTKDGSTPVVWMGPATSKTAARAAAEEANPDWKATNAETP